MSWIGFSLGFIPQLSSFQRIFYTEDTSMFLVIYLTLLSITLVSSFVFIALSIYFKVFLKWFYGPLIALFYSIITGLLSLDAYAFTSFSLIENGYEVPFNPAVYLIDVFILFPMFLIFHYFVTKNGINKIKALPPDDIRRDVL